MAWAEPHGDRYRARYRDRELAVRRSPTTVRSVVTLFGLVLRDAIDEHYLFFDPTARLHLRDGPGEPRPAVTPAEVRRIAARMPDPQSRMLVVTAAGPSSTSPPTPAHYTKSAAIAGSGRRRPTPPSATSGSHRS